MVYSSLIDATPPMATALFLDDSVNTCDCCGRTELKATVAMLLDSGSLVHYGQVCAARNTGKTRKQVTAEIRAERDAAFGRAQNELLAVRRTGTKLTGKIIREVAAKHRADAKLLIQSWG